MRKRPQIVGTTILAVRRNGRVALAGDGQVTLDKSVVKKAARKVRRLAEGNVVAGFAGGAADAFALLTRFEEKLAAHQGQLERAAVELVRDWRTRKPFDLSKRVGIRVCEAMAQRGVLTRPVGNVIVLMPPYCTTPTQVRKMVKALDHAIEAVLGRS